MTEYRPALVLRGARCFYMAALVASVSFRGVSYDSAWSPSIALVGNEGSTIRSDLEEPICQSINLARNLLISPRRRYQRNKP